MPIEKRFEIRYWMALTRIKGVGSVTARRLVEHFGSVEKVFSASPAKMSALKGVRKDAARGIAGFNQWDEIDKEIDRAEMLGISIISLDDNSYPRNLCNIHAPPLLLYLLGSIDESDENAIAIVGSRNPSPYGLEMTERFGGQLAQKGFTVISGLARGIDTAAHRSALEAGGRTIAVLGSGLDVIYPPENGKLYREIAGRGALISEFPLGTGPDAVNFPRRNRLISGLSRGVLVIEAALKSGSLITANYAAEQGRDVYVVPGNINSMRSRGSNRLINEGAILVDDPESIVQDIQPQLSGKSTGKKAPEFSLDEREESVFALLEMEPVHIDMIIKASKMNVSEISSILLNLEMMGAVKQQPGKFYIKNTI